MALPASPAGLRTMRRIATGLLVAATVVYVATGFLEAQYGWIGFVRAFAEAAMVGALADWFAVTALFRHPLGLPIPHTAVIPKSKDRIGQGLGRFVEENFLAPSVVAERLHSADIVGSIARWIATANNSTLAAMGAMHALRTLAASLTEDDMQRLFRDYLAGRLERIRLAPLAGELLAYLLIEQQHRVAVDATLRKAAQLLHDYEPDIRRAVAGKSSWLWRRFGIDQKITERLIAVIEESLSKAAADPQHIVRKRIEEWFELLAERLRDSPEFLETGERLKTQLLQHPAFAEYVRGAARDLLAQITSRSAEANVSITSRLADILKGMAETILVDPPLRAELNRVARAAVGQLFELQRMQVGRLISETVDQWDAEMLSSRLEAAIGRDLQYIRINGALIGGVVGLVIHSVSTWLHS